MNTPLLSNGVGELPYSDAIPPALLDYLIKKAIPRAVSGIFGDFLFQEIRSSEAIVWYNNYRLLKDSHFTNHGNLPKLELQFSLNNSFCYHGEGLGRRQLRDGSFNLSYVPNVNSEITLRPGRVYTTFDIYLTPLLVRKMKAYFPVLEVFLEKVSRREAAMLCPVNQLTTIPMSNIIDNILDNKFTGGAHGFFVGTKVIELLMVILERVTNFPTLQQVFLRDEELELIYEAKDELLKNLDQPISLPILSRKVGLNMHKLKVGFQEIYGSTVLIYRLHARMKEAKLQLLTTDLSIEKIGYNTAYSNSQHFSKAYKKYYGHTPARARKDRDGERKKKVV